MKPACCPSSSSVSVSSMVMIGLELPSVKPPHVTSSTPPYLEDENKMKQTNIKRFQDFTLNPQTFETYPGATSSTLPGT